MSDQIFINGKQIELSEDTIIALTLQINDLSALGNRQGNFVGSVEGMKDTEGGEQIWVFSFTNDKARTK